MWKESLTVVPARTIFSYYEAQTLSNHSLEIPPVYAPPSGRHMLPYVSYEMDEGTCIKEASTIKSAKSLKSQISY